jgi:hypothetical protein
MLATTRSLPFCFAESAVPLHADRMHVSEIKSSIVGEAHRFGTKIRSTPASGELK